MYHEGTYYWWADTDEGVEIIQSFDMSEEVFGQISMPESFEEKREKYRSLGVLNGSIVLFRYPSRGDEREFDIWGMEKDEFGGVSWSKLLTIGPLRGIEKPLVFVSSDELLMEANEGQIVLYNARTQQLKELPINGHPARAQKMKLLAQLDFAILQLIRVTPSSSMHITISVNKTWPFDAVLQRRTGIFLK
ncbi:F-box protein CPR1, partial [Cucurbita argyrosperma subsp. sororia]